MVWASMLRHLEQQKNHQRGLHSFFTTGMCHNDGVTDEQRTCTTNKVSGFSIIRPTQCGHLKCNFSWTPDLSLALDLHVQLILPLGFSQVNIIPPKQNSNTSIPAPPDFPIPINVTAFSPFHPPPSLCPTTSPANFSQPPSPLLRAGKFTHLLLSRFLLIMLPKCKKIPCLQNKLEINRGSLYFEEV